MPESPNLQFVHNPVADNGINSSAPMVVNSPMKPEEESALLDATEDKSCRAPLQKGFGHS